MAERIIALVAEDRGTEGSRFDLDSSLAQDLGMEGDDTVEFFEKFGKEFRVDLTALWERWDRHFIPEGLGVPPLGCIVVIVAGVFVGGVVHEAVKWIPVWASMIGLMAAFGWIFVKFFSEPPDDKLPIKVQDLVDAATSDKWVRQYEEPVSPLFRTLE